MSRNLTQEALADRANMTPIAIGYIEQGRRWPRLETLLKIAKGLEIDVSELLKGVDD